MLRENARIFHSFRTLADIFAALIIYLLGIAILSPASFVRGLHLSGSQIAIMAILIPVMGITFNQFKLYVSHRYDGFGMQFLQLFKAASVIYTAVLVLTVVLDPQMRWQPFLFAAFHFSFLSATRFVVYALTGFVRSKGLNSRAILLVGMEDEVFEMAEIIRRNLRWGIRTLGYLFIEPDYLRKRKIPKEIRNEAIVDSIGKLPEILNSQGVDAVFFAVPPKQLFMIRKYMEYCIERGLELKIYSDFFKGYRYVQMSTEKVGSATVFSVKSTHHQPIELLLKEVLDRTVALVALVFAAPVMLAVAIAIKLDSRGPILFSQERVMKNNRIFPMYKFRTMVVNAEELKEKLMAHNEMDGPVFKIKNDPRITRVGAFLRKTSLDELPQLFNVLFGHMSLVGPRPPLPKEVAQYENWQRRRLSVKPGITCTWQISGRNNIDFTQWMKMDMSYIDDWSLKNDIKILFKTIPAVFTQRGAS